MKKINKYGFVCIAGGSISNFYMGKPIRDIDIFCSFDLKESEIKELFGTTGEVNYYEQQGYEEVFEIPYLFRLDYKGYELEIIKTYEQKVFEFDIRFRQFYFYQGEVYAAKGAIEDIKNKEIVVVNPSTPMQTFFRTLRFRQQFGFQIPNQSREYLLWAFNQKEVDVERAKEYYDRQAHKASSVLVKRAKKWLDENKMRPKIGEKEIVYIKDAKFPFHPSLEPLIAQKMQKRGESLSFNYELIKNFKEDKRKSFRLNLEFPHYEGKVKQLLEKIKSIRVRYLMSPYQSKAPFPHIKIEELPKRFKEYFNGNFMNNLSRYLERTEDKWNLGYLISRVKPLNDNPEVELKWNEYYSNLSDLFAQNELIMVVDGTLHFHLRKCDNGKYTISGFVNGFPDGCGFYIDMIGKALKEQHGEWFDFENEDLKAHYRYDYGKSSYDYYFGSKSYDSNYFKVKQTDFLMPIKLPKKKEA